MVDTSYGNSEWCGRDCDTGVCAVWEGVAVGLSTGVDVFDRYMSRILEGCPVEKYTEI
jgi:hypothetical protein